MSPEVNPASLFCRSRVQEKDKEGWLHLSKLTRLTKDRFLTVQHPTDPLKKKELSC
jgi:hypothetical protein